MYKGELQENSKVCLVQIVFGGDTRRVYPGLHMIQTEELEQIIQEKGQFDDDEGVGELGVHLVVRLLNIFMVVPVGQLAE